MLVIDTNVLFAAVSVKDVTHKSAIRFLTKNTHELYAPQMLQVELASLLFRKFDSAVAEAYFKELTSIVVIHENADAHVLMEYVKHKKVRGCDAFFAYLAERLGCSVVSFDRDLIAKCHGILLTPKD